MHLNAEEFLVNWVHIKQVMDTLQNKLKQIFKDIDKDYRLLSVEEFEDDTVFKCIMKAAFAKNYEFNVLCSNTESIHGSFFLIPALRGICEDLIAIKYLSKHILIDRNELMKLIVTKRLIEGTIVQSAFFKEQKPGQIILSLNEAKERVVKLSQEIKDIFVKNGLRGDKDFPSVAQMATDSKLIKLYNYLYYATSEAVHFEPRLLMRLGWSENIESKKFTYSTRNFDKYYFNFCSYYAAFLFIEFYKAFKKDLSLKVLFGKQIDRIIEVLEEEIRMPEIVTFEECNIKPPSTLIQILSKVAHSR